MSERGNMYILLGSVAVVVGLLGAWQRRGLKNLSTKLLNRNGQLGETLNSFQSENGYLIGGLIMAAAGVATLIYGASVTR